MVPAEKIPEPWPPITNEPTSTVQNGPTGGWRTGHRNPRADETQQGDFFNQA
jgi:hypothetical protein